MRASGPITAHLGLARLSVYLFVRICVLVILLFLLSLAPVVAFTVSPASRTSMFSPRSQEYQFTVTNPNPQALDLTLVLEGDLAEFATVPASLTIEPSSSKTFTVTLVLPETLEPPGRHELLIVLRETRTAGGTVGAVAELAPAIRIDVPYAGAYLEYTVGVQDGPRREGGQPVTIMVTNLGAAATMVTPQITLERLLFGENGGENSGEHSSVSIASQEVVGGASVRFSTTVGDGLSDGAYRLTTRLDAQPEPPATDIGGVLSSEQEIWLGTPEFQVQDARITSFAPGEIGRVTLTLETSWNQELVVTAQATVSDGADIQWKLPPQEITFSPGEPQELSFIWDSEGAAAGNYSFDVSLSTSRSQGEVHATFTLEERPVTGPLPLAKKGTATVLVLLLVLAALLLATILWRVRKRRS